MVKSVNLEVPRKLIKFGRMPSVDIAGQGGRGQQSTRYCHCELQGKSAYQQSSLAVSNASS